MNRTDPYRLTTLEDIARRRAEEQRLSADVRAGDDSWSSRRRAGLAPKPSKGPHRYNAALKGRSAERTVRALELHRSGLTRSQIAAQLAVSPYIAGRLLNRVGVRLRTAPRQAQVLDAMAVGARTVPEISRATGGDPKLVASAIEVLHTAGRIRRISRGVYVMPVNGGAR